jgi:hypothetical protein
MSPHYIYKHFCLLVSRRFIGLADYMSISLGDSLGDSLFFFNFMTESMKLKQKFGLGNHFAICGFFVSFAKEIIPQGDL